VSVLGTKFVDNIMSFHLPDFPGRESLYHPLDAEQDQIRVITVYPSEDRSSAIRCILQTISIQDGRSTVPYDAISYHWGPAVPANLVEITVYGNPADQPVEMRITRPLAGALRQLRAMATESGRPLVLWTDAVCIEQRNNSERSQQVAIMRTVYEAATSVLIWLGEGDPLAEIGLVNLFDHAMHRQAKVASRNQTLDAFDYSASMTELDIPNFEQMNHKSMNFSGTILALLNLSYWYRGWTLQEACANDYNVLHYGRTRCSVRNWDTLGNIISDALVDLEWRAEGRDMPALPDFQGWVLTMSSARRDSHIFQNPSTILSEDHVAQVLTNNLALLARSTRQTTDPRDQVYSQIGCMAGFMLAKVKPDYSLSTEQVFIATTFAVLHTSRSWSHVQFFSPSKSPYMPSWAIDFRLAPDLNGMNGLPSNGNVAKFEADGTASFRLQELRPGILYTAGFIHDEVSVAVPFDQPERTIHKLLDIFVETEPIFAQHHAYATRVDRWISICRTLCMGMVGEAKFGQQHAAAIRDWWVSRERQEGLPTDDLSSVFRELLARSRSAQTNGMNFVITRNGRLGLAPRNVDIGDRLAILAGGRVPFIIRKVGELDNHDDSQILLGACYLDGEMFTSPKLKRLVH
jgi:hypothetical protein